MRGTRAKRERRVGIRHQHEIRKSHHTPLKGIGWYRTSMTELAPSPIVEDAAKFKRTNRRARNARYEAGTFS